MLPLLEWVSEISRDADPLRQGFQAQWSYVAANLLIPLVTGVVVAVVSSVAWAGVARLRRGGGGGGGGGATERGGD